MNIPKIIVDTDPGGDDAFALLWLGSLVKRGFAELLKITTVDGNVPAPLTFTNACKLLQLCDLQTVEVGQGVRRTDITVENATHIHGNDGLGGLAHTLPDIPQSYETARFSDDILIEALNKSAGEITLIALGPLTNLAKAETKSPGILKKAKEIILMAGAFNIPGNVTSEAEFNIAYHPEAAATVFQACNQLVILPLNVTRSLIFTPEMAEKTVQSNPNSPTFKLISALCDSMTKTSLAYRETQGMTGFLVHDAATIAYLFYPELFLFRRAKVLIELEGRHTRGKTLYDGRHAVKHLTNAWIAHDVDAIHFMACLTEDLKWFEDA